MAILVERESDAYPKTGTLTFEDYADNILRTVGKILENRKMRLLVEWSEVEEETDIIEYTRPENSITGPR